MVVFGLVKAGELVSVKGNATGLFKDKASAAKALDSLTKDKAEGVVIQGFRLSQTVVL